MEAREEVDQTRENLAVVINVFVRTAAAVSDRQTVVVVDEQVRLVYFVDTHSHEERSFWINGHKFSL